MKTTKNYQKIRDNRIKAGVKISSKEGQEMWDLEQQLDIPMSQRLHNTFNVIIDDTSKQKDNQDSKS